MKPSLAKIIQKILISRYFKSVESDPHIRENAYCMGYANIWSLNRVHWLSRTHSPHRDTSDYECEDMLDLDTGVARACFPIMWIHTRVAWKPKMQRLPATLHNTTWMVHCEVCHGSVEDIRILDPVDVKEAHSHIASRYYSVQWYVQSPGWGDVSFG